MPDDFLNPACSLAEIQRLICSGDRAYRIEPIARVGAQKLRFDEQDIVACVLQLDARRRSDGGHFYKSMPSETRPGLFHDVYKILYCNKRVYVKLQLVTQQASVAIVIQFKKDKSA